MTYHLLIAARVIRRAQGLICVSPYTTGHIQKYFRPKCAVITIPNGLALDVFARRQRRMSATQINHNPYTICSVGGWGEIKNIKTLLRAFTLHSKSHKASRLVLFGSELGPGEAGECWAVKHNLHHGVVFMGRKPRDFILDFLENEADLMVHPSRVETHGMVLIEAMACGVPVIGGQMSGAIPWTLEHGNSGYLCDICDPHEIAHTIGKAINDSDATLKMTEHAWKWASQRFSIEQAAVANMEFFERLA
ncbi:MAG: glycosyltransferase family 4 protein [Verrucomicrobia bacterium]|nr:MAG: glycosyltransferase family 4 protein [Verrucomicrobiota bacterium]